MARVEVRSMAWGYVQDGRGRPRPGAACGINTTVYSAASGGSPIASNPTVAGGTWVSDSEGYLPGFVDTGTYTLTETDGDTEQVDAPVTVASATTTNVTINASAGVSYSGADVWTYGGADDTARAAVTDWGPIVNTLLANGARRLFFRAKPFPVTTQIVLPGFTTIEFVGEVGRGWTVTGEHAQEYLLWNGAATTPMLVCSFATTLIAEDLGFWYGSGSFTGKLLVLSGSGNNVFSRCEFRPSNLAVCSADSLVSIEDTVNPTFSNCAFFNGQHHVRGGGAGNADTDAQFDQSCMFQGATVASVVNPGTSWNFKSCTWEMVNDNGFAIPVIFTGDYARAYESSISIEACKFWDFSVAGQIIVNQPANQHWDVQMRGNFYNAGYSDRPLRFLGPGSLVIENEQFQSPETVTDLIELGDTVAVPGSVKSLVRIVGVKNWLNADFIKNLAGHARVTVGPNNGASNQDVRMVAHEVAAYVNNPGVPTVTAHAGSGVAVDVSGTDTAGIITITAPGGGATAGPLVDIAFKYPFIRDTATSLATAGRVPAIQLTPVGGFATGYSGATAAAADPYYEVDSGTLTAWRLGVRNNLAADAKVAYSYRVMGL